MANIKWIKIATDIFDDEKILFIDSDPDADAIIVVWFKLLCLAGKQNNSGVLMLNEKIPYTEEMLSIIFRRPVNIVNKALTLFEKYEMIEIVDGVITIPNWGKHQTLDQIENRNQYMKNYMADYRQKQKNKAVSSYNNATNINDDVNSKLNSKLNVNEADKDKNKNKNNSNYLTVITLYNEICISFPKLRSISENRKKAINARLKNYEIDDFKTLFEKAEASSFLKGANNRNWSATFDWLICDSNMAKVLDGNYDNRGSDNKQIVNGIDWSNA